jgi:beta-N-acetylhexosaminidase
LLKKFLLLWILLLPMGGAASAEDLGPRVDPIGGLLEVLRPGESKGPAKGCPEAPTILPDEAAAISLERAIGQLIVVGFAGRQGSDPGAIRIRQMLRDGRISGVLLLKHNLLDEDSVREMLLGFRQAGQQVPFIMVDQEGGPISRFGNRTGVSPVPSAAQVARIDMATAEEVYRRMAGQLAALGVNVNLGPVLDLRLNVASPVISALGRSYGTDPKVVAAFGEAFVDAHRDAGVLTALKHFPGHGSSSADSHHSIADVTRSWTPQELEPFSILIARGKADMVMVGHLTLNRRGYKTGLRPASLSQSFIRSVLRDALCFRGVVVTDDLRMAAITNLMPIDRAAVEAIRAGNDVIIIGGSDGRGIEIVDQIARTLKAAATADLAVHIRILEAYQRVISLKRTLPSDAGAGPRLARLPASSPGGERAAAAGAASGDGQAPSAAVLPVLRLDAEGERALRELGRPASE